MASTRVFTSNTSCNTIELPFLIPIIPSGTGPYTYFADGTIWDEGTSKAIPPEKTDHPTVFGYGGKGRHK
jgi:hypothetical protein